MFKRALAVGPMNEELGPAEFAVEAQEPELFNQEHEKLRNERREWETAQETYERLIPGFDLKRLVL